MTIEEEKEHVILRLKMIPYLNKKIIRLNCRIEEIDEKIINLHSISYDKIRNECKNNFNKGYLYDKKDECLKEIERYSQEILRYDDMLQVLDQEQRQIIIDHYVCGYKIHEISEKLYYERTTIYQKINKALLKIIKK